MTLRTGLRQSPEAGLTLLELILVMALLTILAAAVAPRFNGFVEGQKYDAEWRTLLSQFRFARSEAISRSELVELWFENSGKAYGFVRHDTSDDAWMPDDRELPGDMYFEFLDQDNRPVTSSDRAGGNERRAGTGDREEGNLSILFWPDGTVDTDSPWFVRLVDGDQVSEAEKDAVMGYVPVEKEAF